MDEKKLGELSKDELISKVLELESILNDFQQSSKDLERALEDELQELETKNASLVRDLNKLQQVYLDAKQKNVKLNSEINELSSTNRDKIMKLESEITQLQLKLVKIEIVNDSMESNDRILLNKYEISQQFNNELLEKIALLEDEVDRSKKQNIEQQLYITNYQNQLNELNQQVRQNHNHNQNQTASDEEVGDVSILSIKEMLRSSPPPTIRMKKSRSLRKLQSLTLDIDRALNRTLNSIPTRTVSMSETSSTRTKHTKPRLSTSQRFSDLPSIRGSPISNRTFFDTVGQFNMDQFSDILNRFDKSELFIYLTNLNGQLTRGEIADTDYEIYLDQLQQLIQKLPKPKKKQETQPEVNTSLTLYRLVSRNLVLVLTKLSSKIYDVTNGLLNNLQEDINITVNVSILLLVDLFETFPHQLGSLISFSTNLIYKIIKKYPNVNSNLVFLLNSITKNATRFEIDEKLQAKLLKIVAKAIQEPVSYEEESDTTTVLLKKNYILCLKNLLILNVSSNYEGLLQSNNKLKPEVIMNNQHQFQTNLLNSHEKLFKYGLSNFAKDVRIAMVELLANLMINLVPSGKFNPIEYLVLLYPLPKSNFWNENLTERIVEEGDEEETEEEEDSESVIATTLETNFLQTSIVEVVIFYLQLEQFQNPDFLSTNLLTILDLILSKFTNVDKRHVQNQAWNKTIAHWRKLIEYLVTETGLNCHEMLTRYVYTKFSPEEDNNTPKVTTKEKKRQSILFFKSKSKAKNVNLEVDPYSNSYQTYLLLVIIEMLLPYGVNFDDSNSKQTQIEDDDLDLEKPNQDISSFVVDILFKLIVNENTNIRNYSLNTLLIYAKYNQVVINQLLLQAFTLVDQEYHHPDVVSTKLSSYSLALSSLIKQTDSNLLQNSIIVKVLSFCTQNLKHSTSPKNTCCWILLSSLVTLYNSSEYVRLNSSQLFIFWKSLLTQQQQETNTSDIVINLKLRNFSLICLLNYLNSVDLTPESLKQIQFLLNKSYNYLSYLESNVLGGIDLFEYNNVNVNLLYENNTNQEKTVINLVLYCKKLVLQCFIKLAPIVKNEINSNMIIFLIKVFSDGKLFARTTTRKTKPVSVSDFYTHSVVLNDGDNCFGVSSKYQPTEGSSWFDEFEKLSFSIVSSINYDPTVLLTDNKYSVQLTTSLVDISIELFILVFPHLSSKIQFSLLEQIRNSLSSTDPLRLQAIKINTSIALNGVVRKPIDESIIVVIIDIIKSIKSLNLIELNSETIGLSSLYLDMNGTVGQINSIINDIVTDSNPYNRGFSILTLCSIYHVTKVGFQDIYNISIQLLNDPNPIIGHFTLLGLIKLFESNLDNNLLIPTVLNKLYSNYLNDLFGFDVNNNILVNLKTRFSSVGPMSKLLQLFITSLGPAIKDVHDSDREKLAGLIVSLSQGVGVITLDEYNQVYTNLLRLFQELIIFDQNLIEDEIKIFIDLLNLIISKNLKLCLTSSNSPTSLNQESIFPFNTSFQLYSGAYECYFELLKIFGNEIITKETINLLWISMNIKPCDALKSFIKLWLETSLDKNWFGILNSIFQKSGKKLIGPFLELNYQHKLLPLSQRDKKKTASSVMLQDEEFENIVRENVEDEEQPISWEFKLFIYQLLNHLLYLANKNSKLIEQLKPKIQDLVKLSFIGSTSTIIELKLQGIKLLDLTLKLFGNLPDPMYPTISILEQQQAQIISALIPCFTPGNDHVVIVDAINVCSKFINLPRINFYSKQRILKTLIYLLEEISSGGNFVRFGFLESMSEFGRKSIQLSILNCWAILKIDSFDSTVEPEFGEILTKYSSLLTSLWILELQEFSLLKYSDSTNNQLSIYSNYWINFISVLSLELHNTPDFIEKYLTNESDVTNFLFILFSQCVESLIKNKNVNEILISLKRLVHINQLVDLLFNDEIFGEVVDLFDRLILIESDIEIQCDLIEIITTIFHTYIKTNELTNGFDKLFELIRVEMLPLFTILPILKYDYDEGNVSDQLLLKHADSAPNLLVLQKTLHGLVNMVSVLPDVVKVDLYGVLLYIFAKIYETRNGLLISIIIPHLKNVINESTPELITTFHNIIKHYFEIDSTNNYSIITNVLLITNGEITLTETESHQLSNGLLKLLSSSDTAPTGVKCIKSLIQYPKPVLTLKYLITELLNQVNSDSQIEVKIIFEILMLFTRVQSGEKQTALYTVIIPLLVKYNDTLTKGYLHEKLVILIQQNPESFKLIINKLSESQKKLVEELVRGDGKVDLVDDDSEEIQLKTFG
ncbi:AP-1 accessory protein LAA1 [Spathaspora sp. JA1]|nr:AP-1 accessory protein LAA1 [Spathaspora sp. JA1]